MTVYNINLGIGWASSGVDVYKRQVYKESEDLFYVYIKDEDYYEQVYSPAQIIDGLFEETNNINIALISADVYKRQI